MGIEQKITIKADVEGSQKVKDLRDSLKDIKEDDKKNPKSDPKYAGKSNKDILKGQLDLVKDMQKVIQKMNDTIKKDGVGNVKEYTKEVSKSINEMKKMNKVISDAKDIDNGESENEEKIKHGKAQHAANTINSLGQGLDRRDWISSAQNTVGDVSHSMLTASGGTGVLGKAGMVGMIISAVAGGLLGLDKFLFGKQEELAPKRYEMEKLRGSSYSQADIENIKTVGKQYNLKQEQIDQASNRIRELSGRVDYSNQAGLIGAYSKYGIDTNSAAEFIGRASKFGGGSGMLSAGYAGGYYGRIDQFTEAVTQLTGALQDAGVKIGTDMSTGMLASLGTLGENWKGTAGLSAASSIQQSFRGAQDLQGPEQAIMYRALASRYKGNYSDIMNAMEQGGSTDNINDVVEYLKSSTNDKEAQINMLKGIFGLGRTQAQDLLSDRMKNIHPEDFKNIGSGTGKDNLSDSIYQQKQRATALQDSTGLNDVSFKTKIVNAYGDFVDKLKSDKKIEEEVTNRLGINSVEGWSHNPYKDQFKNDYNQIKQKTGGFFGVDVNDIIDTELQKSIRGDKSHIRDKSDYDTLIEQLKIVVEVLREQHKDKKANEVEKIIIENYSTNTVRVKGK